MSERRRPIQKDHLETVIAAARAAGARLRVDLREGTAEIDFSRDAVADLEAERLDEKMEAAMAGGAHG